MYQDVNCDPLTIRSRSRIPLLILRRNGMRLNWQFLRIKKNSYINLFKNKFSIKCFRHFILDFPFLKDNKTIKVISLPNLNLFTTRKQSRDIKKLNEKKF